MRKVRKSARIAAFDRLPAVLVAVSGAERLAAATLPRLLLILFSYLYPISLLSIDGLNLKFRSIDSIFSTGEREIDLYRQYLHLI